jgi:phage terminase small subunit
MADKSKFSDKHEIFCLEYMKDMNGTQAAIRAGYSKKTARVSASRLLSNPAIASRVRELKQQKKESVVVETDFILEGLIELANRCMQKVPVLEWNYAKRSFEQATDPDTGEGVWQFDSKGAAKAFELLGKHKGVFEKDNNQKQPKTILDLGGLSDDQLKAIAGGD